MSDLDRIVEAYQNASHVNHKDGTLSRIARETLDTTMRADSRPEEAVALIHAYSRNSGLDHDAADLAYAVCGTMRSKRNHQTQDIISLIDAVGRSTKDEGPKEVSDAIVSGLDGVLQPWGLHDLALIADSYGRAGLDPTADELVKQVLATASAAKEPQRLPLTLRVMDEYARASTRNDIRGLGFATEATVSQISADDEPVVKDLIYTLGKCGSQAALALADAVLSVLPTARVHAQEIPIIIDACYRSSNSDEDAQSISRAVVPIFYALPANLRARDATLLLETYGRVGGSASMNSDATISTLRLVQEGQVDQVTQLISYLGDLGESSSDVAVTVCSALIQCRGKFTIPQMITVIDAYGPSDLDDAQHALTGTALALTAPQKAEDAVEIVRAYRECARDDGIDDLQTYVGRTLQHMARRELSAVAVAMDIRDFKADTDARHQSVPRKRVWFWSGHEERTEAPQLSYERIYERIVRP